MPTGRATGSDRVGAGTSPWRETYERLSALDASQLTAADLDALADALFWLDLPEESAAARRDAYAAHLASGAVGNATLAAWRLYYDHALVGELAVANGWLERARGHVDETTGSVEIGWLAVAEADCALLQGNAEAGLGHAQHALEVGRSTGDRDLTAMALQTKGRVLVELGRVEEGLALLDEAMVSVISGELEPLFTGWVYCNLLMTCRALADVRRAGEWTDAAMRWCDSLREGRLYPGLCRIHAVELACLRGEWVTAEADAVRACDELTAHDPRYAGEAFYLAGEMRRLVGDLEGAQEAFTRAHELGRLPQPGLALVRLAQDRTAGAAKALRLALQSGPAAPLPRAQLLAACVEAELHAGDVGTARDAADELVAVADESQSSFLAGLAWAAEGSVLFAEGDLSGALARLREACTQFQQLGYPYEAARAQLAIGLATRTAGDDETAAFELEAALATFDRLGALPDADRVRSLLHPDRQALTRLTEREVEVLRLVAQGSTNREIGAALFVSEHTVARHLSNIFSKIGVTSRAAATAYAYEHQLV